MSAHAVRRRVALVAALAALAALSSACVGLPDTGPVTPIDDTGRVSTSGGGLFSQPRLPVDGETPQNTLTGFLQAMTAVPVSTDVARRYLSRDAQLGWDPARKIITYDGRGSVRGTDVVTVELTGAHWADAQSHWRGKLGTGDRVFRFPMVKENDNYRIGRAPNALIVPSDWFRDNYRPASVYYLDPTARILVPEPVFVPDDEQLLTYLVQALLAGPGQRLADVVRTFVPPGLTPGLSVTVDANGVAAIGLGGDAGQLTPQAAKLMVYQFAWTLRQVESVTSFRITIGDQPVTLETGGSVFSIQLGSEYQPNDVQASAQLFGIRNGLLEEGPPGALGPVDGPFGRAAYGLVSVAVNLTADKVAAVTGGGATLSVASMTSNEEPVAIVLGGSDLLRPAWDFADQLWSVDQTPDGAQVTVYDSQRRYQSTSVRVPGITNADVKRFIVSRDGTRLVAVVRGARSDRLLASRIRRDTQGHVLGASRAVQLDRSSGDVPRIRDIGWRSPTSVAVLHMLTPDVAEVTSAPVDGSISREPRLAQRLPATAVIASPAPNEPLFTLTADGLYDPENSERVSVNPVPPFAVVQYAG